MPESRMGKRKKIKGYVELIYSGEKPIELEAEDLSANAIGVVVSLDHRIIDKIRMCFSQVATIKHHRLPDSVTGVLHRIEKVSNDRLKLLFSFSKKVTNLN